MSFHYYQLVNEAQIISAIKSNNSLTPEQIRKFACEIDGVDCDLAAQIMEIIEVPPDKAKWYSWDDYENFELECHRCLRTDH